mgnify:CR=1 FL=1
MRLVELPTPDETNDNIVAYWVPARLPAPGEPLDFAYEVAWQGDAQQEQAEGGGGGHGKAPLSDDGAKSMIAKVHLK